MALPAFAQVRDVPESEVKAVLDQLGITLPYEVMSRTRIAMKIDQLRRVKFPRFRGHPNICVPGVRNGQKARTVHA
jgi:hypothetical protein